MTDPVRIHALAILKGAVEGDDARHRAFTMAMHRLPAPLVRAGLVTDDRGTGYVPTDPGRRVLAEHHLDQVPGGRANAWVTGERAVEVARLADEALTRIC